MRCKVCNDNWLTTLWDGTWGAVWFRCMSCGSDSSSDTYDELKSHYNAEYVQHNLKVAGSADELLKIMGCNLDWFEQFETPEKTFLDVGCNEGSALVGMNRKGWESWGFDVNPAAGGERVVIAERLDAGLFNRRFGAVMVREVIEHIEDWRDTLKQSAALLLPSGLLQVQTPRPTVEKDGLAYCRDHLQLFAPFALKTAIQCAGFQILDRYLWENGQKWMARKVSERMS